MRALYDADTIRAAEAPLLSALPPGTLMQRAATALARRCAQLLGTTYGSRVVLLVGSGNNGGDALFAGAALARRGARVDALLVSDAVHEDGKRGYDAAGGRSRLAGADSDGALVAAADLVVDGLLGIGATGPLRPAYARLARIVADSGALVVAVDVPTGVDASTGAADADAVRADVTVTFGAGKVGLFVAPGAEHAGAVEVVDIGLSLPTSTLTALDARDVADLLPEVGVETDKYRRGVLGVVAGSDRYTGAAVLAVGGALAAGVGMVRFVGAAHPAELVRRRWPEAVVVVAEPGETEALERAGRVQAWAVGSGLGTDEAAAAVVRAVLRVDEPVLLDADALTVVAEHPEWVRERAAPTLLTPHSGEFARLRGLDRADVEAHRLRHVRDAACDLGAVVLLKGSSTLVADPDGRARVNTAQTPFLGTAGSGDVLTGACGALLASGLPALDAGSAGAFLHGLAGLVAAGTPAGPITAMDLVRRLPHAVRAVRG
jgi:ADP-dependent NAD(P)H-hydrate dehydratase / NAD(P)H-hydrate epimerase